MVQTYYLYIVLLFIIIVLVAIWFRRLHDQDSVSEEIVLDAMKYAPPIITDYIKTTSPSLKKIINFGGSGVTFYAASHVSDLDLKPMINRISYLIPYLPKNKNIKIYYFAIPLDKYFNTTGEQTENNVNSAVCITRKTGVVIYLYRKEEASRILLHELIHATGNPLNYIDKYNNMLLSEAVVDALATYIESSIFNTTNLEDEVKHSKMQVDKLLTISNQSFNEFIQTPQKCNVREYYLIKHLVLEWLSKGNLGPSQVLNLSSEELYKTIKSLIENNNYITSDIDPIGTNLSSIRFSSNQ
jgi:hypothetical protein